MSSDDLEVFLDNKIEEVSRFLDCVEQFGQQAGLSNEQIHAVMLSLDEAVTNTISYGYPQGGEHKIRISLKKGDHDFTAVIEDDGVAFNPLEAPEADLTLSLEQRPIGGLGIHFMRTFMDSLNYSRTEGKNVFTLVKKL